MWRSTLEILAAQLRSVTEIAPKSPFLCVNRGPLRYCFCAGAKAIWYFVTIGLILTWTSLNWRVTLSQGQSITNRLRALTICTKISVKTFRQMVLVFFWAPKTRAGLSCTIYKIPVNFSLSLDLKPGTVNLNKWYRKFRSFRWKRQKGNTSKGITSSLLTDASLKRTQRPCSQPDR